MGDWVKRRIDLQGPCRSEVSRLLTQSNVSLLPYRRRIIVALARQLADARSKTGDPYWGAVGQDVLDGFTTALNACNKPAPGLFPPLAFARLLRNLDDAAEHFQNTEVDADGFGFGTIAEVSRDLRGARWRWDTPIIRRARSVAKAVIEDVSAPFYPEPAPRHRRVQLRRSGWHVLTFNSGLRAIQVLAPIKADGEVDYQHLGQAAFDRARSAHTSGARTHRLKPVGHHLYAADTPYGDLRLSLRPVTVGQSCLGGTSGTFYLRRAKWVADL